MKLPLLGTLAAFLSLGASKTTTERAWRPEATGLANLLVLLSSMMVAAEIDVQGQVAGERGRGRCSQPHHTDMLYAMLCYAILCYIMCMQPNLRPALTGVERNRQNSALRECEVV